MVKKTEEVYLSGKCKWAHTTRPDKYNKYSVLLYLDAASLAKARELKETKPGILNTLSKDEDGYYMKFSRPVQKEYKGRVRAFEPPFVCDPTGRPLTEALIGNGSDVTLTLELYSYKTPGTQNEGRAVRLKAITVHNLIPYTLQSVDDRDTELLGKALEHPVSLF